MERGGGSASIRHRVGKCLRQALRNAVDKGRIAVNPALKVKLTKVEKKKMNEYDEEQVGKLLKCHWAFQNRPLMGASKPASPGY